MRIRYPKGRGQRPRILALALSAALVSGAAVFVPAPAGAAPAQGKFYTSFESGEPQAAENRQAAAPVNFSGQVFAKESLHGDVARITGTGKSPSGESPANAADGQTISKWLTFAGQGTLTYELTKPAAITGYRVTSANDAPERDPKDFKVQASTDGKTWVDVDQQTGQKWATATNSNRFVAKDYKLGAESPEYKFYRLQVTATQGADILQLAEFELLNTNRAKDEQPRETPMSTVTKGGPRYSFTAKPGVGWTGVKSVGYAGHVVADGDASASNALLDVDVTVPKGGELSYKIFPELDPDLTYASTHVALDLVFDDGSRLSSSGARDIYGVAANAQAQGDGKTLFPDQWNSVKIDLSSFEGKTVKQVLLTYSQKGAKANTPVGGYVDDITIDVPKPRDTSDGLISYVDTRRGTNSSGGFSRGNNFPAAAWPNGFNFITPFTDADTVGTLYAYQAANNDDNLPELQGVGFSHEPSIWMGDRNQFIVQPSTAATPDGDPAKRALAFQHDNEVARPDYYGVTFENGLRTESTPTDHGGVFRFTFTGDEGSVIVDRGFGDSGLKISDDGTVSGWIFGGSGWPGKTRMFVAGKFDTKPVAQGDTKGGRASAKFARFDTSKGKTVELRVATSFISQDQAQKNLDFEVTGRSFDEVRSAVKDAWNERLGVITDVQGANDAQLVNLYSNLYRLNLYPNSQFENVGSKQSPKYQYASPFRKGQGEATPTKTNAPIGDGKLYVNNGFWDTYRTAWPMYSLLYPNGLTSELVDGFVQHYRDGGWVSRWSSPGYADLMTGTSSDVAFADAYMQGALPTDVALDAYDAALKNATVRPATSAVGRKGLERSPYLGFTDATTHQSASWGLEGYINDFGMAKMAAKLAQDPKTPKDRVAQLQEEAKYLENRANNFVEMYNPNQGLFTARHADGSWDNPDKKDWGGAYTEASGWTFAFHAPHNVDGLAALYGGRQGLIDELKEFTTVKERADRAGMHEAREARDLRMGMLGLSNQIAHHIPYVAVEAGDASFGQEIIAEAQRHAFVGYDIGQGYPGDEDNGEFSAWYIFSALGFYPLQMGTGNYTIGTPMFDSATVHMGGKSLKISAPGASAGKRYVAGVSHNGKALNDVVVDGDLIRSGGTLQFTMSDQPQTWGDKNLSEKLQVPSPLEDASGATFGTLSSTNAVPVGALVDNDMRSAVTFPDNTAELVWKSKQGPMTLDGYTLTSTEGRGVGAPESWTLEGSADGTNWTVLDHREGQKFPFGTQLRPFFVDTPSTMQRAAAPAYTHFRLKASSAKDSRLGLAEIELFAKPATAKGIELQPANDIRVRVGDPMDTQLATLSGEGAGADTVVKVHFNDGSADEEAVLAKASLGTWKVNGKHTFASPGEYTATITATAADGSVATTNVRITVFRDDTLAGQMNNTCIGVPDEAAANCDGLHYGFIREQLEASGFKIGATNDLPDTVPGGDRMSFDIPDLKPGDPDNVTGEGQTVAIDLGEGASKVAFVVTANEGNRKGIFTLRFADGSTQEIPYVVGDWVGSAKKPVAGNTLVGSSNDRTSGTKIEGQKKFTGVFVTDPVEIAKGADGKPKQVVSLTMPKEKNASNGKWARTHLFAVASDGDRSKAEPLEMKPGENQDAVTGEPFTAELAAVSGGLSADGAKAYINWGDGSDVVEVAVKDGKVVGTHTFAKPGEYTVWVTVDDGRSTLSESLIVLVKDKPASIEKIVVTTPPVKTKYVQSEDLNLEGLVVSAQWSDGHFSAIPLDELKVAGFDKSKLGTQTLTVTWVKEGKTYTATFDVTVGEKEQVIKPVPNPVAPDGDDSGEGETPAPDGARPRPGLPKTGK